MRAAATFIAALALIPTVVQGRAERARFLMGTVCEVAAHDPRQIEAAFAEAKRIESMLSTWIPDSALSRLNHGAAGSQPAELKALLDRTLDWSRRTNGAFDPRIKALIDVWKTREDGALPSAEAIRAARAGTEFEEGAFGKGYAIDRMLAVIDGEAMINFGGQIGVRGAVRVSIADPEDRQKPVVALTLRDGSLSTSSGSEKTFEVAGRRFSHLIDPRTGEALPPRGSVSVIADDALTADILSTALYVLGEDDGLRWADANGVAAIFIDPLHHVRLSAKARERARGLELLDRNFSLKE